jgi:hypothetical protein
MIQENFCLGEKQSGDGLDILYQFYRLGLVSGSSLKRKTGEHGMICSPELMCSAL